MDHDSVLDWLKCTSRSLNEARGMCEEARAEWTDNPPQALRTVEGLLKLAHGEILRLRIEIRKLSPEAEQDQQ